MKKLLCATLTAALMWSLASCGPDPAAEATATPAPTETAAQAVSLYGFSSLPVTEAGIRDFYAKDGYFTIVKITPYEGDFLVELTDTQGENAPSLLYWVFGATGRQVQMNGMGNMLHYEITGRGRVAVEDSGISSSVPWKGFPATYEHQVIGDENGAVDIDYVQCVETRQTTWLDPAEPLYMGWWSGDGPSTDNERREQVYDARLGVDGLSFAFIPQGGSPVDVGCFGAAVTSIPALDTSFDQESRVFTLRLHNVSLSSGKSGEEYSGVSYPYEFPAGSLGRDSHFVEDAQIQTDGEDVVVSFRLTGAAYRFTVESGNLGYDNIPCFRLVFREHNSDLDGYA